MTTMKRLIPLLGLLIAFPAAADMASIDTQPASFIPPSATRPATDWLRLASLPPQWQLRTVSEVDDVALPEVSVQSPRYEMPALQDQATAPLGAFRAIPWAVEHPSQAWRIFLPSTN